MATPVDPKSRMDEIGPSREIEVQWFIQLQLQRPEFVDQGWTRFDFPGRGNKVSILTPYPCCVLNFVRMVVQHPQVDQRAFYRYVKSTITGDVGSRSRPVRHRLGQYHEEARGLPNDQQKLVS